MCVCVCVCVCVCACACVEGEKELTKVLELMVEDAVAIQAAAEEAVEEEAEAGLAEVEGDDEEVVRKVRGAEEDERASEGALGIHRVRLELRVREDHQPQRDLPEAKPRGVC